MRAVLGGIKSQPELNGELVEVLGGPQDGRVPVKLVASGKKIKVKTESLFKVPAEPSRPSKPSKELPKPWEHAKNIAFLQDKRHDLPSRHKALVALTEFVATGHAENVNELLTEGLIGALLHVARDGVAAFREHRDKELRNAAGLEPWYSSALCVRIPSSFPFPISRPAIRDRRS